jgi:TPR repeat protein
MERQIDFRANRKAGGGVRMDMWLPPEEAARLKQLMRWKGQKSFPQVVLDFIHEAWLKEVEVAAKNGHAEAQFEYASLYARMCALGKGKSHESIEAENWYLKSWEQGYQESAVENNLGLLSLVSGEERTAFVHFRFSVQEGNRVALYNLGLLGLAGRGELESGDWDGKFWESARKGFRLAQEMQGVLYAIGKSCTQDCDRALEWLRRARKEKGLACENYLALLLSTFPDDEYDIRNGHIAVTIAERLVQSRESIDYLNTLATAYAEAKRFDDAIKTQKKVLLKLRRGRPSKKRDAVVKDCERRVRSYMAYQPWRDASLRFNYCWDFGNHEVWILPNLYHV